MSKSALQRTYWCDSCHVPLLGEVCGACGTKGRNLAAATLVPVFRPELNFLRKNIDPTLHPWLRELELWVTPANYTYYSQGEILFKLAATTKDVVLGELSLSQPSKRTKKDILERLREANRTYVEQLQYEAEGFIRETVARFSDRPIFVSFSGGKDSTAISHLVMNALGRSDVLHIFADTSIEMPDTYKYIQEFQKKHPLTPFITSKSQLDFFKTAEIIGPPSRILRWCCSTHKTNPLSTIINGISPDQGVLTFDGIRKSESNRRSQYPRISNDHKVARETLARPIINWSDFQVWIYLLYNGIYFNNAYKKGFRRVGCIHCPFNSQWSINMTQIYYYQHFSKWIDFLHNQAKSMKHPNPEAFVEKGWRTRAGGRGLDHYKATIESSPCFLSDTAISYQLLSGEIKKVRHFLRPLGPQTHVKLNGYSEIFLIHDKITQEILASVEVGFEDRGIRVNFILKKNILIFRQRVEKQIRKLQACIYCGSCEAKCPQKALCASGDYSINNDMCISCLSCVSHKCPAVSALHFNGEK